MVSGIIYFHIYNNTESESINFQLLQGPVFHQFSITSNDKLLRRPFPFSPTSSSSSRLFRSHSRPVPVAECPGTVAAREYSPRTMPSALIIADPSLELLANPVTRSSSPTAHCRPPFGAIVVAQQQGHRVPPNVLAHVNSMRSRRECDSLKSLEVHRPTLVSHARPPPATSAYPPRHS